ncbi:hypothetical protein QEH56_21975 [Pelagicoccus enzymogenes]|uniref:hypothetical protein n=1 Tax=Pelagicoccus enzymogenes TaxID=2773457 RepID=UPI00280C8086|nr:hypothetical protein [Pelagicoccus enzymogenes]MDQ8200851.1 hypothetical protein [Pelagicoccus enzymogenes]
MKHALAPLPSPARLLSAIGCVAAIVFATPSRAFDSVETSLESLDSDLFAIELLTLRAEHALGDWELQGTFSLSEYDIDFQPVSFDLLGQAAQLREQARSANLIASKAVVDKLTLDFGIAYRDGFSNYRSVWLDTYFDQHFEPLEGVPGHELFQDVQPSAASATAGLKWEYLPANAVASVSVSRIQDNVSPGYEIDFDGIRRGELVLATTSLSLVTENVLTPRLRSRIALTATETSARSPRYAAEIALNAALGDRWIWRNKLGGSTENPQFDAHFIESTIEFHASDSFAIYLQGRSYQDSGEIENALLFTTAAPELDNDSVGIGFRYLAEKWSAKVSLLHSRSQFLDTNVNVDFFRNLYVDADWLTLQVALGKRF